MALLSRLGAKYLGEPPRDCLEATIRTRQLLLGRDRQTSDRIHTRSRGVLTYVQLREALVLLCREGRQFGEPRAWAETALGASRPNSDLG